MKSEVIKLRIGIDATNLRHGGGFNQLPQLLRSLDPIPAELDSVIVWCNQTMADALPKFPWLKIKHVEESERSLIWRIYWQQFRLAKELRSEKCGVLFSPGGSLPRNSPVPTVVMSRNMLPFERTERRRYPLFSFQRIRLELLRRLQSRSFQSANGLIFLTQYARDTVLKQLKKRPDQIGLIPHGVDDRFLNGDKAEVTKKESKRPFKFLYVSTIDLYKHQWNVARAIHRLNQMGFEAVIEFIGSSYGPAEKKLRNVQQELDPSGNTIRILGSRRFEELHQAYHHCDAFIFASSCENLPNILLEAMASGLPILSSNLGPMPEVLGDSALYFNPESVDEMVKQMEVLIRDTELRDSLANEAHEKALSYSWKNSARSTFDFILTVYRGAVSFN